MQPFLPLLDTSFPFLLLQASPTHAFSTQLSTSDLPETNHCDCTKSRKEKGAKEWVGGINKSKQKRRGGSEGKQRGGGFFDKWLFIGGVRQQKQGRGYLHTHKERKRIYGFFSCLLKMNQ